MSIAQRVFLHPPAWNIEIIQGYISQHIIESEHLDFKSPPPWSDGMDAAKDVAAFANHLGGDIIIGIDEDGNDRAKDWNPMLDSEVAELEEKTSNWLKAYLYPREFVQTVRMERVPANKANHSVLVVSVPPYPDLVGIEKGGNRKGEVDFRFPIRVGNSTRWLIFEEIMKRFANSTRSIYIKLKALADSIGVPTYISFTSPVLVVAGDELKDLLKPGRIHCEIIELTDDVIKVQMNGSENPVRGRKLRPDGGVAGLQTVRVEARHKLTIPLEFVRAVWKDRKASELEHLSIALAANIVWNGDYWSVVTSALSQ